MYNIDTPTQWGTVKLAYTDHPRDPLNVVLMHIWSIYPGSITRKVYPWEPVKCVFISRWTLYTGGLYSRFHCIDIYPISVHDMGGCHHQATMFSTLLFATHSVICHISMCWRLESCLVWFSWSFLFGTQVQTILSQLCTTQLLIVGWVGLPAKNNQHASR